MKSNSICSKCVLDIETPNTNLILDENGICNNCLSYEEFNKKSILSLTLEERQKKLEFKIAQIKRKGLNSEYDCVLGLSGGMDSAYLALRAHQLGLRPLVVHFDNGWNTELAVDNINNIITTLGFDLHTYVINWSEFKDLQLSYLKASVIDVEVPTDQFIYATLYEVAYKYGIKYILDGNNIETEFWGGSWKWAFDKLDLVNLKRIHNKYGSIKLKKFPKIGKYQRYFYTEIVGIESAYILNYLPYNKIEVEKILEQEFGWKNPGGKHYESIFTRFYQGYILPSKFKIDKRKAHLSNLIWSNQITRDEALNILNKPTYDKNLQIEDLNFILKKFELTKEEFEEIMNKSSIPHEIYGTENVKKKIFQFFVIFSRSFIGKSIFFLLRKFKIIKNLH